MSLLDRLFLLAYELLSPGVLIVLSFGAVVAILNSFYWLTRHGKLLWRPSGLLAVAGSFVGTALFYTVLLLDSAPPLDISRGASRILWSLLCLSVIYNNSGSVAYTLRRLKDRGRGST